MPYTPGHRGVFASCGRIPDAPSDPEARNLGIHTVMMSIGQTRRSIAGICLAFLIGACGSGGNDSSGTGGSGKEGGTTGNSTGGTAGSPKGGASGSAAGGTAGNRDRRDDRQRDRRDDGQSDRRDGRQPTGGTSRAIRPAGQPQAREARPEAAERAAAWAARERAARRPPGPAAGAGARAAGRRAARAGAARPGERRARGGGAGVRRGPAVPWCEWLREHEAMAHGQSRRRGPVPGCGRQDGGALGGLHPRSDLRRPATAIQYLSSEGPRDQRLLPPHPGLGERSHRQSRTESPALCHRLRRQQVVWAVPADDESSRLARVRGDCLAQHHHLQGRPAAHDRRPGLADPAV